MGCFYYKCALTNSAIPAGAKVYMYIVKPDNNIIRINSLPITGVMDDYGQLTSIEENHAYFLYKKFNKSDKKIYVLKDVLDSFIEQDKIRRINLYHNFYKTFHQSYEQTRYDDDFATLLLLKSLAKKQGYIFNNPDDPNKNLYNYVLDTSKKFGDYYHEFKSYYFPFVKGDYTQLLDEDIFQYIAQDDVYNELTIKEVYNLCIHLYVFNTLGIDMTYYDYGTQYDNTNALRLLHKVYNDYREKEDTIFKQSVHEN